MCVSSCFASITFTHNLMDVVVGLHYISKPLICRASLYFHCALVFAELIVHCCVSRKCAVVCC